MGKKYKVFLATVFLLFFLSCSNYTNDLEQFFEYWTSIPRVTDNSIEEKNEGMDGKYQCVKFEKLSSNTKSTEKVVKIEYYIRNPKKIPLKINEDVVSFTNLKAQNQTLPKYEGDYYLELRAASNSNTEENTDSKYDVVLDLILKESFFKKFNRGAFVFKPEILLVDEHGRKFSQNKYTKEFKINAKPLALEGAVMMIDEWIGGAKEYVLCFNLPDFLSAENKDTHDDIITLRIDGNDYEIDTSSYEVDGTYKIKGETENITKKIKYSAENMNLKPFVEDEGSTPQEFTPQAGRAIYFKTGKFDGAPRKEYIISLFDKKSLQSELTSLFSGKGQLAPCSAETADIKDLNAKLLFTPAGDPLAIQLNADKYVDGSKVEGGVKISYTIKKNGEEEESNTVDAPAILELEGGKDTANKYEITAKAKKEGDNDSVEQKWVFSVKAVKSSLIDGSDANAWQLLKEAVEDNSSTAPKIIKIKGSITADNSANPVDKEIIVNRKVKIKSETSDIATINANSDASDATKQRRIFKIEEGGDLTLVNVNLIGGNAGTHSEGDEQGKGGAVYVGNNGIFTFTSGSISGNKVEGYGGGAVFVATGGSFNMNGGSLENNKAIKNGLYSRGCAVYVENGNFIMNGGRIAKNNEDTKGASAVYFHGGTFEISGGVEFAEDNYLHLGLGQVLTISNNLDNDFVANIYLGSDESGYEIDREILASSNTDLLIGTQASKFKVVPQKNAAGEITQEWIIDTRGKIQKPSIETWAQLKRAVELGAASEIIINGEIKAIKGDSEIEVSRAVSIKGDDNLEDIIDADCQERGENHRLFKVLSGGKLNIEELTLRGGHAEGANDEDKNGGAVYLADGGEFTMKGTVISNNTASNNGGAVYISAGGTLDITDSFIKGNKAVGAKGAGVYVQGKLLISGESQIGGYTATVFDENYVYLEKDKTIEISGELDSSFSSSNPVAVIEPETYSTNVTVLSGSLTTNYNKFTVLDKNWVINSLGKLQKKSGIAPNPENAGKFEVTVDATSNLKAGGTVQLVVKENNGTLFTEIPTWNSDRMGKAVMKLFQNGRKIKNEEDTDDFPSLTLPSASDIVPGMYELYLMIEIDGFTISDTIEFEIE